MMVAMEPMSLLFSTRAFTVNIMGISGSRCVRHSSRKCCICAMGKVHLSLAEAFTTIVGSGNVVSETEYLRNYAHDETEELEFLPDIVLKPRTADEVSAIMKLCNEHRIPVTPRGAG